MKTIYTCLTTLLLMLAANGNATTAATLSLDSVFRLGLPVLDIETVDRQEPTCDYVSPPEGSMGRAITNATKVPGRLNIYFSNSTTPDYASGEYEKDASGMTIRIRGNTSAYGSKKPYKIKLQKKANLMLQGDDKTYKDKDWILVNDFSLCNYVGHKINEFLGLQWAPRCRYVNVVVNGEYRGMYLLLESVKRNTKARLDVSESGMIFEHDPYWWNENNEYIASIYNPSYNYTFKYPEWEDMTDEQRTYAQQVIGQYESALTDTTYHRFIDVESFAAWLLGHDLFGTRDSGGSNMYFTKYDDTDSSLVTMANMWDFDSAEQQNDKWADIHLSRQFKRFFANDNKTFARKYVDKWNAIKGTFFTDILAFVDRFAESDEGRAYDKSSRCDNARWGYTRLGIDGDVKQTHDWFDRREVWLEKAIAAIDTIDHRQSSAIDLSTMSAERFSVLADGHRICVSHPQKDAVVEVTDAAGRRIYRGTDHTIHVNSRGIYIVRVGGVSRKVLVG